MNKTSINQRIRNRKKQNLLFEYELDKINKTSLFDFIPRKNECDFILNDIIKDFTYKKIAIKKGLFICDYENSNSRTYFTTKYIADLIKEILEKQEFKRN